MPFVLSRRAERDLAGIYRESKARFGREQAAAYLRRMDATFRFLSENPRAARPRSEIDPAVRVYPYQAHVVVYVIGEEDLVRILRVRHGRENWFVDPL